MEESFSRFLEQQERGMLPQLLDIVQIDGRWAQVAGGGTALRYLDSGQSGEIDWQDYELKEKISQPLMTVLKLRPGTFPKELAQAVHWGPEDQEHKHLKLNVTVFGIFRSKSTHHK